MGRAGVISRAVQIQLKNVSTHVVEGLHKFHARARQDIQLGLS